MERKARIAPEITRGDVFYPEDLSLNLRDKLPEMNSLTDWILKSRGFETIDQAVTDRNKYFGNKIPYWIAKNLIIIDSLDADIQSKIKLFAYRIWELRPNYRLIKEFLPEGTVRLDDIKGIVGVVMTDESELGKNYELVDNAHKIIEKILHAGGDHYYERYQLISRIAIRKLSDPSISESEKEVQIAREYNEIRRNRRRRFRREAESRRQLERRDMLNAKKLKRFEEQRNYVNTKMSEIRNKRREIGGEELELIKSREHWSISVIERLYSNGLSFDEIVGATKFTRSQVEKGMTALRIDGRIEVNPKSFRKTARLTEFVIEVENLLKEGRGRINYEDYDELARKLNSTKGRIQYAIHLLILLGRIEPISRGQSAQRRELERRQKYS